MLTYLKWPSLEDQRKISRLFLLFKIVRKLFIVPDCCLPASAPLESTRAQHSLKLAHIQSRIDIYKQSFLPRVIATWNNLDIQHILIEPSCKGLRYRSLTLRINFFHFLKELQILTQILFILTIYQSFNLL